MIQAVPVLRMLRRARAESEIYWWIDAELSPLLEGDPDLTGHICFHRKRWASPRYWPEMVQTINRLRQVEWDWVIDLQALARSAVVAWLARGRVTVGLDDYREGAAALYDVRVPRPSFATHAVDWYLEVVRTLKVPVRWDFEWLPARPAVAEAVARRWRPEGHRWIALHPGARWPTKQWPAERYAETVRRLSAELPGFRFVILGGATPPGLGRQVAASADGRCLDLTGQTSLPEMIEWLRRSELLVSNDSGPMHVAAALGRPVVALFGPTDPRRTGPYGQVGDVLRVDLSCAPCFKSQCANPEPLACLKAIAPAQVCAAVQSRLGGAGTGLPRPEVGAARPAMPRATLVHGGA